MLLSEFGLEFEEIRVSLNQDNLREKLGKYSPSARVPVLIDDNLTVWDSLAICEYISETYLNGRGWPDDPGMRAEARAISAEMHAGFAVLRNELPMNCRARKRVDISTAAKQDILRIDQIWSECIKKYSAAGPWLFGRFSIADCMYAPVVLRFATYGMEISGQAGIFMKKILENSSIMAWKTAAGLETEILEVGERGRDT